jgi:hypothetical protein
VHSICIDGILDSCVHHITCSLETKLRLVLGCLLHLSYCSEFIAVTLVVRHTARSSLRILLLLDEVGLSNVSVLVVGRSLSYN